VVKEMPPKRIRKALSASCKTGKRCYASADMAWQAMTKKKGKTVAELRAAGVRCYRHRECGFWHLGHSGFTGQVPRQDWRHW
jgi:hypothetical protein